MAMNVAAGMLALASSGRLVRQLPEPGTAENKMTTALVWDRAFILEGKNIQIHCVSLHLCLVRSSSVVLVRRWVHPGLTRDDAGIWSKRILASVVF